MIATQIHTIEDISHLIEADSWRMEILKSAAAMGLPDWAIGAGFVRSAVWDALTRKQLRTALPDIDVVYFNAHDKNPENDRKLSAIIATAMPELAWDIKNQAIMHTRNGDEPYRNTADAIAHWLETPTCIAARLDSYGNVQIIAPYGIDDLLALRVKPTPSGRSKLEQYRARMATKKWDMLWPGLIVEDT